MSSTADGLRERLSFDAGPQTVTLESDDGRAVTGRDGGTEYMYTFTGRKIAWLPPAARDAIQRIRARRGDMITLTRHGRGQAARWEAERYDGTESGAGAGEPRKSTPPPTPPNGPSQSTPAAPAHGIPADLAETEMLRTYMHAVNVALAAQAYARERGLHIAFAAEDIRAIAATLFIQSQQARRSAA
jgi:hypothetical protein